MNNSDLNTVSASLLSAFSLAGSQKSNIGPNSASEAVKAAVDSLTQSSSVDISNGGWIALRDNTDDGFSTIALAQLSKNSISAISDKLQELKVVVEKIDAVRSDVSELAVAAAEFDALEKEISFLIGQSTLSKTATFTVKDGSTALQSYLNPLQRLSTGGLGGSTSQLLSLEISQGDFLNGYHFADGCPICQANAKVLAGTGQLTGEPLSSPLGDTANYLSSSGSGSAATTYTTSALTSSSDTNTILSGYKWDDSSLSFSIYNKDNPVPYDYISGLGLTNTVAGALTTSYNMWDYRSDVQLMFTELETASGLTFDEIVEDPASGDVGDLRVAFSEGFAADGKSTAGAFAYYPSNTNYAGDIWFNATDSDNYDLSAGTKGFQRGIHEAGHALGLSHPHDSGSLDNSTLASIGEPEKDGYRYSVMTYNQGGTGSSYIYDRTLEVDFSVTFSGSSASVNFSNTRIMPSTPMILDVEALEHLYGASTANSGDTTYDISTYGSAYLRTISDRGANETDTIDASSATRSSTINLEAGSLSSINVRTESDLVSDLEDAIIAAAAAQGVTLTSASAAVTTWTNYLTGTYLPFYDNYANPTADDGDSTNGGSALYTGVDNLAIARSASIENAIGGSAADTITGNDLGNVLTGNGGNDTIDGDGGDDVAVFTGNYADYTIVNNGDGSYTITDSTSGRDGVDTISNVEKFRFADIDYTVASGSVFNVVAHQGGSNGGAKSNVYYSSFNRIDFSARIMAPHEVGALKAILYKSPGKASELLEEALKSLAAQNISLDQFIAQVQSGMADNISHQPNQEQAKMSPEDASSLGQKLRESILKQVQEAISAQNNSDNAEVRALLA